MKIPAWLQPLHGRDPSAVSVVLTHTAGLLVFVAIALVNIGRELSFSVFQWVIMGLLAWGITAGISSLLTPATRRYYTQRPGSRWIYISLHFIQPLALLLFFDAQISCFLFLWLFPMGSAALLNLVGKKGFTGPLAGLLFAVGVLVLSLLVRVPLGFEWYGYLLLAKLILCLDSRE